MAKGNYPFTSREEMYRKLSDDELRWAMHDAREALRVNIGGDDEGYWFDDCGTIQKEQTRRTK